MKGQKNEILTRPESRHSSRPNVFYFLPTAHFLKQLPTHIAHIAKAPRATAETKTLSESAILPTRKLLYSRILLFLHLKYYYVIMNVRYKIGLLLSGFFLLAIILKLCIFCNMDDQGFLINISTEILGAIITLLIVDRILKAEEEKKERKLFAIAVKSLKNPLRRYINMWLHISNSIEDELIEDLSKATSLKEYMLSDKFISKIQWRSFNEKYTESDIFGSKDNRTLKQIVPKMHEQFIRDIDKIIANYAYAFDFQTIELLQHFGETAHLYGTFYFWNTVDIGENRWFQLQKSENIKAHFESLFILIEKYNNNVVDTEKWTNSNILTLTKISGEVPTVKW